MIISFLIIYQEADYHANVYGNFEIFVIYNYSNTCSRHFKSELPTHLRYDNCQDVVDNHLQMLRHRLRNEYLEKPNFSLLLLQLCHSGYLDVSHYYKLTSSYKLRLALVISWQKIFFMQEMIFIFLNLAPFNRHYGSNQCACNDNLQGNKTAKWWM